MFTATPYQNRRKSATSRPLALASSRAPFIAFQVDGYELLLPVVFARFPSMFILHRDGVLLVVACFIRRCPRFVGISLRWAHNVGKFLSAEPEPRYSVRAFLLPGDIAAAEVSDNVAGIRACVAPSKGAELSSFQVRCVVLCPCRVNDRDFHGVHSQIKDATGEWLELLHHGNDYVSPLGPGGWQGRGKVTLNALMSHHRCLRWVCWSNRPKLVPRCWSKLHSRSDYIDGMWCGTFCVPLPVAR
jgi:hypothetical protein